MFSSDPNRNADTPSLSQQLRNSFQPISFPWMNEELCIRILERAFSQLDLEDQRQLRTPYAGEPGTTGRILLHLLNCYNRHLIWLNTALNIEKVDPSVWPPTLEDLSLLDPEPAFDRLMSTARSQLIASEQQERMMLFLDMHPFLEENSRTARQLHESMPWLSCRVLEYFLICVEQEFVEQQKKGPQIFGRTEDELQEKLKLRLMQDFLVMMTTFIEEKGMIEAPEGPLN